jgi:hypothetical protein
MGHPAPAFGKEKAMKVRFAAILMVLAIPPTLAQDATLGRLFFTPEQRAALDRERLLGISQRTSSAENQSSYTFNGAVRRSGGPGTHWINGEPRAGGGAQPGLPAGDTYHPSTGERESVLGDGRIIVKRNQPAP